MDNLLILESNREATLYKSNQRRLKCMKLALGPLSVEAQGEGEYREEI